MHYRLSALLVGLLVALDGSAWAQQQTGPYIQVSPTPSKLSVGGPGFVQVDANGIASVVAQAPGSGTVTNTPGALALGSMVVGNGGSDIKTVGGSVGGAFTTAGPFTTTGAASGVTLAFPSGGPFTFTFPAATATIASLAGAETFTNKIYNGGQLSGTFNGNPTFSGVPLFTNLVPGTQVACLGLDSGFHLVTLNASCGAGGGGISGLTAGQVPLAGSATTLTSSFALGTNVQTALGVAVGTAGAFVKNNGDALSGTFSGAPTFSGIPKFTGLSTGTIASGKNLGLDSSNNLVVNTVSGGGTGCTVAGGSGDLQKNDGAGACAAAKINDSGSLTVINYNTSALTAAVGGAQLQIGAADTTQGRISIDTFGNVSGSALAMRVARGTDASKTATQSTDILGTIAGWGYGATGYSSANRASISMIATENWSDTAQGTKLAFSTTPNTTVTSTYKHSVEADGGLLASSDVVASQPTGGSKGAGTVNVSGGYYVNGVMVSSGVGVQGGQSPLGMGDNATALASGHYYYFTNAAFTAPRSKNLPDSATQGVNDIEAVDVQQTLTSTNTLSLCAAGTDTLNGTTNGCVKISVAGGGVGLHNDGAGKWTTNWLGNVPVGTAAGQLLIWDNTKKIYTPAVLVQGANMTITNADGSITLAATGGGSGAITLVSTLTASNSSPDLAWTGLTGNDYQLVCRNLTTSVNSDVTVIQFGTGGTPTWNTTAANYSTTTTFTSGAGAVSGSVTSGTFTGLMPAGQTNTGTIGSWLNANLVSLTSGSEKEANGTSAYSDNSYHTFVGHTTFTTTVTAVRVHDETGGNLKTGTCSLYARST